MLLLTSRFVHNAKPEELTYDKMIEVAKAHERTCPEYQIHKQAHSMAPPVTTPILCFKQALCRSLSRKVLPRRPVANADALTTMVNAQPLELHVLVEARRTTGYSSVEALGKGTVCQDVHPSKEDHSNRGKEDHLATSSSTKAGDVEEVAANSTRRPLPRKVLDAEYHTR